MSTRQITVLTPTIGTKYLEQACQSVASSEAPASTEIRHLLVVDGAQDVKTTSYITEVAQRYGCATLWLPDNTNSFRGERWYGHRIYGYASQLINSDYVCFLDEDNFYRPDHIRQVQRKAEEHGIGWSRRTIVTEDNRIIGYDDFEAICKPDNLGYTLIDTSCWCFANRCLGFATNIVGKWGADRQLTTFVAGFKSVATLQEAGTGEHTLVYRSPDRLLDMFKAYCTPVTL